MKTLAYDFVQSPGLEGLGPTLTFARATTAHVLTADGTLLLVDAGVPRFTGASYSGADGATISYSDVIASHVERKGLLIEEARTNFLIDSEDWDAWVNASNLTIDNANITAPDGALTGNRLTVTATATTNCYQVSTTINSTEVTGSVYTRRGSGDTDAQRYGLRNFTTATDLLFIDVDWSDNSFTYGVGSTGGSLEDVGGGWFRLVLVHTAGITAGNDIGLYTCFTGGSHTAGEFGYTWGAQLEEGAFPTSYIPTTTVAVTRDDDLITDQTDVSWFNEAEGTFYTESSLDVVTGVSALVIAVDDNTVNMRHLVMRTSTDLAAYRIDQTAGVQASIGSIDYKTLAVLRRAQSYAANDVDQYGDGAGDGSDSSVILPTGLIQFHIGTNSSQTQLWNGHIARVAYYDEKLDNATVLAMTELGAARHKDPGLRHTGETNRHRNPALRHNTPSMRHQR